MANLTLALSDRSWKEFVLFAFIGFCFGFLVLSSINNSTIEASPTDLGALAALGSRAVGNRPQMRGMMLPGIGSGPLERLAITAIEANYLGNRDVSANARFKDALASMNPNTQERFSRLVAQAEDNAKELADFKVTNDVKDMAGVSGPLGFFDPIGYATTTSAGKIAFYREVELKHGRLAMLATLGFLVGENFHPLFGGNIDTPAIYAFQETPLQQFWPAVVAAIAIPEVFSVFTFNSPSDYFKGGPSLWTMKDDHMPGDLGFDPLGLKPTDPQEFKEMQTKELNNGRLAMIAYAGIIGKELLTGIKAF
jgi:hypothetical protein